MKWATLILLVSYCTGDLVLPYNYHVRVGIPKARELMREEFAPTGRIVGGSQTTVSAIPHQAGIIVRLVTGWTSLCGGSLVSNNRVITAAHCWNDGVTRAESFTVVLGSLTIFTGGTRIDTADVTVHPSWGSQDIAHDVAIVRISNVEYSNNIQAIPLPSMADVNNNFEGLMAIVSGYGKTSDAQNSFPTTTSLYHASVLIISNTVCQASSVQTIPNTVMCTSGVGGLGTCDGDSGGPVTVVWNNRRILVGIVSLDFAQSCERGLPSVHTRVTPYLAWIEGNM